MFEPMNFVNSLQYLVKGMVGIFVVMGVIILTTVILNAITSRKKNKKDE